MTSTQSFEEVFGFPHSEQTPEYFFKANRGGVPSFIPKLMGDAILEKFRFFALSRKSDIWVYRPKRGIWTPNGEELILSIVTNWLGELYRPSNSAWTEDYIRNTNYVSKDRIEGEPTKIVLRNGVYDLITHVLSPFDPDIYALQALPFSYNPEAKAEKINKFLEDVCPERVQTLKEMAGYCLLRGYPIHRFFILEGSGRNGKGTYINLVKAFLGKENVSSVSLQHLDKNRFKPAELHGKLANLNNDIPAETLKNTGILKQLTSGDLITVEKKGKDPFQMENYAKMIFSANQVPMTLDDSDAFHRRAITIKFLQEFDDGVNADPKILEKITTEEEKSGFFNEAIVYLKNLLDRGKFYGERSIEERKMEYIKLSNPIQYFALTCIAKDLNARTYRADLYNAYVRVCERLEKIPTNDVWFGKTVRRYLPYTHEAQETIDGRKVRIWKGIRLLEQVEQVEQVSGNTLKLSDPLYREDRGNTCSTCSTCDEEPQSLKNKIDEFLDFLAEKSRVLGEEVLEQDWFFDELVSEGWKPTDVKRVSDILKRDGMIFEPRPGYLKRCTP